MKKSPVVTIVATGIGAALFFVLGRFVSIPSPVPNTTINVQYGLLAFMSVIYGPLAGALMGLIGHALIDFSFGWGIWWSWVIASAVYGLMMGIAGTTRKLHHEIGKESILPFNICQVISHIFSWGVVAPVLDIVIYQEPMEKLFAQGLFAGISNAVTTAIVGTLLCLAYAAAKPKAGSLKQDKE